MNAPGKDPSVLPASLNQATFARLVGWTEAMELTARQEALSQLSKNQRYEIAIALLHDDIGIEGHVYPNGATAVARAQAPLQPDNA